MCDAPCEPWAESSNPDYPTHTLCTGVPGEDIGGYYEVEDSVDCRVLAACSFCLRPNGSVVDATNPSHTGFLGTEGTSQSDWGPQFVYWRVISDEQCGNPSASATTDSRGETIEKAYGIVFRFEQVPTVDGVPVSGEDLNEEHKMLWYKTDTGKMYLNGYNGRQLRKSTTCPQP